MRIEATSPPRNKERDGESAVWRGWAGISRVREAYQHRQFEVRSLVLVVHVFGVGSLLWTEDRGKVSKKISPEPSTARPLERANIRVVS